MNFQPQLSQEDLAKFADNESLDFQIQNMHGHWCFPPNSTRLLAWVNTHLIRLAPGALTDYGLKPGMKPHNPDDLTADVITEGGKYRAMLSNERRIRRNKGGYLQRWNGGYWEEYGYGDMGECSVGKCSSTYRVPVNTPFPKTDHIVELTEMVLPTTEQPSATQSDTPLVFTLCPHCNKEVKVPLDHHGYSTFFNCSNCGKRIDCWLRLSIELTAALSQRDEARRLLGEAKSLLRELDNAVVDASWALNKHNGYEPIINKIRSTRMKSQETLKQITEYLNK